jgi:SHS2 domain-containing protein
MWEHFHHQADICIRGVGGTLDEAFAEAALAMTAVMCSPEQVQPKEQVAIQCDGEDAEILFVDWLNALIYEMAVRSMLFGKFEVTITNSRLEAKAWGETVDWQRHAPAVEIKGATYAMIKVAKDGDRWIAQCVVDV